MNIYALIPLISVTAYIALISLILTRPLARVHKVFILYLAVSMLWSLSSFILHADFFPAQTLLWNRALIIAAGSTTVVYYHFVRAFFNKAAGKVVYLGYAGLAGIAIFISLGGMLLYSNVIDGVLYHDYDASFTYIFCPFQAIFLAASIFYLVQGLKRATTQQDRNRIGYLLAAIAIWIPITTTNLIPALAIYSVDQLGNIAAVLIISYAILRHQLLDIKLVLRKGLIYSSLTVFLTAIYILFLFVLQMLLHDWVGYTSLALAAGFALLVAFLFNPLRNFIQNRIDWLFYRETYDYRQILLNFSNKISNVLDLGELAQSILEPIVKAMHVKKAALLFMGTEDGDFNTWFAQQATTEELPIKLQLINDSPIVAWLASEGKAVRRELMDAIPQFKSLWEVERNALKTSGVEVLCPIRSKGNLIGILSLGEKQSESAYSEDEIDMLMTMANEAAIALENARMLDSIKNQQRQVEQLLAQAVLAQEDERKRISADLHDSVAQWLVAASYRAQTCGQVLSGDGNAEARDELTNLESTITKSLKELRRVVIGLRPPALEELGLTHSLRQILEELRADGIDCKFNEVGIPIRLSPSVEIAAYRIVQEAIANIRKHAGATKVNLRLQFQEDKLMVEIRDNGRGFALSQTLDSAISIGRMGLLGMKQRAEMLGGDIKIKTTEGAGTMITLRLPIQQKMEEK